MERDMIIETRGDVVRLSGNLQKNQWLTIRAAAGMLLHEHPHGIIVDCSQLQDVSEEGAKTFLEAIRDIDAAKTRIIVVNLPEKVLRVLKTVPGVRSQLPIASSIEEARASLGMHRSASTAHPPPVPAGTSVILVLLLGGVDLAYGADLAARLARAGRAEIRLTFLLEVTRTLPLNAPLVEQEKEAQEALAKAMQYVRQYNMSAIAHVERVRDAVDGALATIRLQHATQVVVGASSHSGDHGDHDRFDEVVDALLHRAPCEVIVGRLKAQG
jgi:anti-anti-sigma regulatory factor